MGANMAAVPTGYDDLLKRPLYRHLATTRRDGSVQVSPMWFDWDGAVMMKFSAQFATSQHSLDRSDTECVRTKPISAQRQLLEKRMPHQHVRHTTQNWRIN
jgi:hypothetical protein